MLRDALAPVFNRELLRKQALQFFVMHNLNYPPEQIQLRDALINALKAFEDPLSDATKLADVYYFNKLAIDSSLTRDLKIFRLAESQSEIIVCEQIAEKILAMDNVGIKLIALENARN